MRRLPRSGLRVGGRVRWLAPAAAALALAASAELAAAGTTTVADGNDRPGPLDIRSVSQGHAGTKVRHTISTFANWPKSLLGPTTPNFLLLEFSTDSDPTPERALIIFSSGGRMIAGVFTQRGRFVGSAGASRPNKHTVAVTVRRSLLGSPAGYRWQAFAFFRGPGGCSGGCTDRAPDGSGRVLHDLRAPTVSFPQPPAPSTTTYNLDFTVADGGGSGLAFWRLERWDPVAGAWTSVDEQATVGPQSVQFVAMPGASDDFRVVAGDMHGNRRVSPVRSVTAPQ